ncbi:ThuA domain-containing protein [Jiulongibacter sediminis]|uniref:Cytochrome C552 n=1 Tax=Jiulongibacter sediminis TaxID=1605367 RepID=A0A0N8HA56_9BACT|nr:ThuA domain-containing protein [Jiulongibacter sediminis]KPM49236.1 cytochrome C552 [Jiulongibacter sediminis]TBX26290.1 cytochrome C552 [Jiulongibacter sediminis]
MSHRPRKKKRKWLKRIVAVLASLIILFAAAFAVFMYKVKNGFPYFEEKAPTIEFPENQKRILLFSKANAFVHSEGIEAAKPAFEKIAEQNNWFLYQFDEGGIFNEKQLKEFDLVIWNNVSGKVLTNQQRSDFQHYIENGGSFMGLHAAGDGSHHWDWYTQNLIGADFSHHPIENHIQEATLQLQNITDSTFVTQNLPKSINHDDEWYVFNETPEKAGFTVLFQMDGEAIDPSGNMLWIKNKGFGMGPEHPNIWFKEIGKGKTFYSALGHDSGAYENEDYVRVLEEMMKWLVQ